MRESVALLGKIGYLVGTVERFNDGKRAEERDRVHHTFANVDEKIEFDKKEEK